MVPALEMGEKKVSFTGNGSLREECPTLSTVISLTFSVFSYTFWTAVFKQSSFTFSCSCHVDTRNLLKQKTVTSFLYK